MKQKYLLYITSIFPILILLYLEKPTISKFYQEQKFVFYWIILTIPLCIIAIYYTYNQQKKLQLNLDQQEHILKTVIPQKGIVEDFLIYQSVWNDTDNGVHTYYKFIPIIKILNNGKRYATYGENCLSSNRYSYGYLYNGLMHFSYSGINGKKIEIGSPIYLYILEELPLPILKENNMITIFNYNFQWKGCLQKIENNKKYKWKANYSKDCIFNINSEIPLFSQPITLFKGIIDNEEQPSIEPYRTFFKNAKKESLFTSILTIPFIPLVSLFITILLFSSNVIS